MSEFRFKIQFQKRQNKSEKQVNQRRKVKKSHNKRLELSKFRNPQEKEEDQKK